MLPVFSPLHLRLQQLSPIFNTRHVAIVLRWTWFVTADPP